MQPIRFNAFTVTTALGTGLVPTLEALRNMRSGIVCKPWETVDIKTCIGVIDQLDNYAIQSDLAIFDCRNNRLAQLALEQDGFAESVQNAIQLYGPERIGVFIGTSNSSIFSSEIAYRHRDPITGKLPKNHDYQHTHNLYSVVDFVRSYFKLKGPAFAISTACSSSAKAFGSAQRMLATKIIDAAIVGGVDTLCLTTLYGFNSLQLLSAAPCKPFDLQRDGLSLGEGAAFVLLDHAKPNPDDIILSGIGESSDAYHMSSPHPDGLGARIAMQDALRMARLSADDIDYINLHGTATPTNDAVEARVVSDLFGTQTPCSSTKGYTGHTLGAAGCIEAVLCALALRHNFAFAGVGTQNLDPSMDCRYLCSNLEQTMQHVLSNSFGFGGSNCSLLFSKIPV